MTENFNIFDNVKIQEREQKDYSGRTFFDFKVQGDAVQGTYIDRSDGVTSKFNNGTRTIIGLLQPNGSIISVGLNSTWKDAITELDKAKFGQIIGIKYLNDFKSKMGFTCKKVVVVQDERYVDQRWLDSNNGGKLDYVPNDVNQLYPDMPTPRVEAPVAAPVAPVAAPAAPVAGLSADTAEKVALVGSIIKTKYGEMEPDQLKLKVMELTGIPFLASRLDEIIEKLSK